MHNGLLFKWQLSFSIMARIQIKLATGQKHNCKDILPQNKKNLNVFFVVMFTSLLIKTQH